MKKDSEKNKRIEKLRAGALEKFRKISAVKSDSTGAEAAEKPKQTEEAVKKSRKTAKEIAENARKTADRIKKPSTQAGEKGKRYSVKKSSEIKKKTSVSPASEKKVNNTEATKVAKNTKKTSRKTVDRADREWQKKRQQRLEARKAEIFRIRLIMGAVAAAILLFVLFLTACPGGKNNESEAATGSSVAEENGMQMVSTDEVRHFSFRSLLSDEMGGDNSVLTVNQFRQILQQLYDSNYILVDFYNIAEVQEREDGTKAFARKELELPAGKIPFVLSQRDVSYSLDRIGKGYATRLVVAEDGQLLNEYRSADGTDILGAYDVVPILEEFIAQHPDFAFENARGVLALTGYNGILGYRTSEILGKSYEEGNPYAVYGVYDVNAEIETCRPVVEALKNRGWHFASYGNNYCSYGAEYAMMTSDAEEWMKNVSGIIGGTDLLLYPCETDIGNWSAYREDNQKYQYLKGQGFRYFCIEEKVNPSWLQIRSDYVRQGIKEIDCYDDFLQIMGE